MKKTSALILHSGGQDSTTALCWALDEFSDVHSLSFDIGQLHRVELDCAARISKKLQIPHQIIKAGEVFAGIRDCALLNTNASAKSSEKFPATFVPGRNLLFLTIAAIVAYPLGIRDLVIGVSQVDFSGYPDCRADFLSSAEQTISLAMDEKFRIHAPFLHKSKADEIRLMQTLGHLELLADTHTCYRGKKPPCGECDACVLRAKGFFEAGIDDPLV